jgi:(4-(4-[2-(gamma-L-glutamylamino)ethyl]phenoxymethyl)furan-2-yl)methanamine synthase
MTTIVGWDIGGVHVKTAVIVDGQVTGVEQVVCTLWLGVHHLRETLRAAVARCASISSGDDVSHAITMTGELAENFANRQEGVQAICKEAWSVFGEANTLIYAPREDGQARFLSGQDAIAAWRRVASANWHVSASWAALQRPDALLIDIGSTTTDIIPLSGGTVAARGFNDADRLTFGELIYTGVTRTSLMALTKEAPIGGDKQRLMAENFSTTADIYRLTSELDAQSDSYPASDGRSKNARDCRARLARMLGRDADEAPDVVWQRLARYFRECQLGVISDGIAQVLSNGLLTPSAPFLAAGAGRFLVPELARRFGHPSENLTDLLPHGSSAAGIDAGVCTPAVAVGLLAWLQSGAQ